MERDIISTVSALWVVLMGRTAERGREQLDFIQEAWPGASLVAQWLRIRLPMQETWVPALVREDPTCRGATKPVRHNY